MRAKTFEEDNSFDVWEQSSSGPPMLRKWFQDFNSLIEKFWHDMTFEPSTFSSIVGLWKFFELTLWKNLFHLIIKDNFSSQHLENLFNILTLRRIFPSSGIKLQKKWNSTSILTTTIKFEDNIPPSRSRQNCQKKNSFWEKSQDSKKFQRLPLVDT